MRISKDRGVADHRRDREAGRLVYPVLSRRSGGLSLGINLFPEEKRCTFDCPYCEVFPFPGSGPFDPEELRVELKDFLSRGYAESWEPEPVRDLCISGNGEPTMSPFLGDAIGICAAARRERPELLGSANIVVITNSTGFLVPRVRELLERAVAEENLVVWAKLDGGTPEAFRRMSRSSYSLDTIVSGIASFAARSKVVMQTMLCSSEGVEPSDVEVAAYAELVAGLVAGGAHIAQVQLYTKARPSPEAGTDPIADTRLADLARIVTSRIAVPVRAFGQAGEIALL
jgi:wyosine [tRNA(Phe)-imidazoG37] synthetase (radical SAM superfamily)